VFPTFASWPAPTHRADLHQAIGAGADGVSDHAGSWWDEQWTISVQHTDADIDRHLQVFAEIAPALAAAQHERQNVPAHV